MLHKIVNGKEVPLTEEEVNDFQNREQEHNTKTQRLKDLQPLKDLYDARKAAYGPVEKQMEILSEEGEQALGVRNAEIKAQYPLTEELQLLKESCTEEELKYVRG